MLETAQLTKNFSGFAALRTVDFHLNEGKVHAIIGPNGAGKTTFFNLISKIYPATGGRIFFRGQDLRHLKPNEVSRLGMARTFQNICLFPRMTVLENVMVGRHLFNETNLLKLFLRLPGVRLEAEQKIRKKAEEYLNLIGLTPFKHRLAANLPYADQRKLEIARALATEPRLLLLDEPAAGMNPSETEELLGLIEKINQSGITILMIEHDMELVMEISDIITVFNFGEKIAEGSPEQIREDTRVVEAYLGKEQ